MKKVNCFAIFLMFNLYLGLQLNCQSLKLPLRDSAPVYSFFLSPAPLAVSTLDIGLERQMTERTSLLIQGHVGYRKAALWESLKGRYWNFGGQFQFRNYLGNTASFFEGPYWNAWIKGHSASVSVKMPDAKHEIIASRGAIPGVGAGWKFPVSKKAPNICVDLGIGVGYKVGKVTGKFAFNSRSILLKNQGFIPAFAFRVVYTPKLSASPQIQEVTKYPREIRYHDRYSLQKRKVIERALKSRGFDPGKVDGLFDDRSIEAVLLFQKTFGLTQDGKTGAKTLNDLGIH